MLFHGHQQDKKDLRVQENQLHMQLKSLPMQQLLKLLNME
jgi:hypothetical protein